MSDDFRRRLDDLHEDLVTQGRRVETAVENAFEAVFDGDRERARTILEQEDEIDRHDVEIERRAVALLGLAQSDERLVRLGLTIVKVNNEIERIADLAADVAEQVLLRAGEVRVGLPATMRVMTNSVIGLVQDANLAMRDLDADRARRVLDGAHLVEEFKAAVLREAQEGLVRDRSGLDLAWSIQQIAMAVDRMADHATNVCEQVIYVETGRIVRHSARGWTDPSSPD